MKSHGTIYHIHNVASRKEQPLLYGSTRIVFGRIKRILYHFLRGIGAGLVGFSLILFLFAYGPILSDEVKYQFGLIDKVSLQSTEADAQSREEVKLETERLGIGSEFSIVVPKIGAVGNVIANVNPAIEKEYQDALKKGVAHAKGTYFPGQGKNIYLFSHSTNSELTISQYNAIFYLLRKLEKGDKITIFFSEREYDYEVAEKIVVSAYDTKWLTKETQEETLILQTCDPPGTTWRRLLVIAHPIIQK